MCFKTNIPSNPQYSILGSNVIEDKGQSDFGHANSLTLVNHCNYCFVWLSFGPFSQNSCTQESPNTTTRLLSAGIREFDLGFALPINTFCHENTSCCPWVLPSSLSLTHPGSHTWSKSASLWLPHVDDKLCPNSRRSICYVHYYSLSQYKAWRKACW